MIRLTLFDNIGKTADSRRPESWILDAITNAGATLAGYLMIELIAIPRYDAPLCAVRDGAFSDAK